MVVVVVGAAAPVVPVDVVLVGPLLEFIAAPLVEVIPVPDDVAPLVPDEFDPTSELHPLTTNKTTMVLYLRMAQQCFREPKSAHRFTKNQLVPPNPAP